MRKTALLFWAILLCTGMIACGRADQNEAVKQQQENVAPQAETKAAVSYIANGSAQYVEAERRYVIWFGLQTEMGRYVSASGVAAVTIKDTAGIVRYNGEIRFTENDFSERTDGQWEGTRYLCGLRLNQDELADGMASNGELLLQVRLDSGEVLPETVVMISDLPSIQMNIGVPQLPATFQDNAYSFTNTVTITQLTYAVKNGYDGTASVEFDVILKLDAKTKKIEESDYIHVGYKLYDSEGVVVGSGQIFAGPVGVGESIKDSFTIWDLDPRETYTLKFLDVS